MRPPSNFFSSLSRLEKRLKLETQPPQQHQQETTAKPPIQKNDTETQTESLGSPIYLYHSHPTSTCNNPTSNFQESEPPQAFFSIQDTPNAETPEKIQENGDVNEIEMLLHLLGLDKEEGEGEEKGVGFGGVCEGEDEIFYEKIIGVKGLKNEKELERLNGWIKYLMNKDGDGGIKQPLRLAHLLLAKASFVHSYDDDDFGGLQFPSSVEEFLHYDPPGN